VQQPALLHRADAVARRLTWRRLLVGAAAADLIMILMFAALAGDAEAAAIGTGFVIGLTLLRWRSGLVGKLFLAVLFTDVLLWMALGVITNIGAGARLGVVLMPAVLTGISVAGLIAAVACLRRGDGRGATGAAGLGAVIIAVAAIAAVVTPGATWTTPDLRIVSAQVAFDQTTLQAPAGQVTVEAANRDLFWHTFTIDELGVGLAVPVGGIRQVTFDAEPGVYRFYCRIPGHETRMAGTLTIR
jgi:plastocyanin